MALNKYLSFPELIGCFLKMHSAKPEFLILTSSFKFTGICTSCCKWREVFLSFKKYRTIVILHTSTELHQRPNKALQRKPCSLLLGKLDHERKEEILEFFSYLYENWNGTTSSQVFQTCVSWSCSAKIRCLQHASLTLVKWLFHSFHRAMPGILNSE